ncbi:DNA replication regulator SLD3-domain-containing protein [Hypoxylon crocopeplum]|nr:DNA replication regulator SLD3-domain-containing protein [Hypoxylon crocopeplum]
MPFGALGSNASRLQTAEILMPSPDGRLNFSNDNSNNSMPDGSRAQKRKRDAEALEELLKPSIIVKPHPPNLSLKPRSLQPLMLLPREYLQLSFLDLSVPYGSFESSRSYESSIKILDLEDRMGSGPVVLIARLETDKSLYALERQQNGLYALCHIGSWVNLQELEGLATASCSRLIEKRPHTSIDSSTSCPLVTPQLHHEAKKRRLAIEAIQSLVKKPSRSRSISTASQLISPTGLPTLGLDSIESQPDSTHVPQNAIPTGVLDTQTESQTATFHETDDIFSAPTAEGIFDNIRNQYLESLYHSMGSLAYFAKGPLSRARATFHLDCDSNLETRDLVDFLKSLVMTSVQIDKKYRETIPGIISKMKPIFQDSDNEQGSAKTKRQKTKKVKLGKDGLYPMEDDRVRKWWTVRKPQVKDDEAMTTAEPHETKLQIAWLRSRETQLQMIIILEVLALEPLISQDGKDSQLPGMSAPENEGTVVPKDTAVKKRNRHNLPSLVDVHADRLCIWQSTALDEVRLPRYSQNREFESQESLRATSDPLKDFCVDIIVPFFSARLPEKCDSINRKLGGPVMMPPPKPKLKKAERSETTTKSKSKSSSAAKRPALPKTSKTLESVLSKESQKHRRSMSRGPSGVIALMRSASTPMLKRENSEPLSMMTIPRAELATSQERASRPPVSTSVKRRSGEDKAKKEALVKAELQDAISTLRRPNREVVGKAMVEAAERRAITSLSQLKKSRKPTQHQRPHDVVKATPVGNRFRDVFSTGVGNQPTRSRGSASIEPNSGPSSSLVPSTAPRKRNHEAAFTLDGSPSISRSARLDGCIDATPARPSNMKQSFFSAPEIDDADILASSPLVSRKLSLKSFQDSGIEMPTSPVNELTETPIKPRATLAAFDRHIETTPSKRRIFGKDATSIANARKGAAQDENEPKRNLSIFARLGWDDDSDELS